MLGRLLSILFVFSLISEVAAANAVILPFKNQTYSWKEVDCHMSGSVPVAGLPNDGADLTIQTKGPESKGPQGSLHFTLKNFRTVMNNTREGFRATFEINDKTVGSVTFTERDGKVWGDVRQREIHTKCDLVIERGENKQITIRGGCEQIGDPSKKSGPRTKLVIDEGEPLTCTVQ